TVDGGSWVQMAGFGLPLETKNLHIGVGGRAASIQRTATFDEGNDHPGWHFVYFFTPPGRPGPADITVRTPDGVEVLPGAFEYFESSKFVPLSGSFFRILYDRRREHLYLSQTPDDRVLVYDLSSDSWLNPIPTGKSPVGISLSP